VSARARRPSMHDVARLAGVSHQTVSRVLNAHPNVSNPTRARVLEAMHELEYRPNAFARGLVTARSQRIGVLSFDSRFYGPSSTLHAIERAARAAGFGVAVAGMSDYTGDEIDDGIDALTSQGVDGIIVIAPSAAASRAIGALPAGVPVVALEAEFDDQPVVAIDQRLGAQLATEHLLELGHHTVWHVGGPRDWREAVLREDGWRTTLEAAGCEVPTLLRGDWRPRSGYEAGRKIADDAQVTAIFAGNDQMALGLVHALAERGRRVPEDVSIVGFDDIPEAAFLMPALTTVRQEFDEVGRRGLDVLLAAIGAAETAPIGRPEDVTIAPELVLRASTASPGSRTRR
jgi:DNA-binding LacI/PurR family transcriptional regulator